MISKTIGCRGLAYFQTKPYCYGLLKKAFHAKHAHNHFKQPRMWPSMVTGISLMNLAEIPLDRQKHQASKLPGNSKRHREGGNRLHHCSFDSQLVVDLLSLMARAKHAFRLLQLVCKALHHCSFDSQLVVDLLSLMARAKHAFRLLQLVCKALFMAWCIKFFVMRVGALIALDMMSPSLHDLFGHWSNQGSEPPSLPTRLPGR